MVYVHPEPKENQLMVHKNTAWISNATTLLVAMSLLPAGSLSAIVPSTQSEDFMRNICISDGSIGCVFMSTHSSVRPVLQEEKCPGH